MDLSFSGAGFMGCYYFGVANCWNKYIPRERVNRLAGASAGSLIAAYYLIDLPLEDSLRMIIEMLEDMRRRPMGVFDRSNQIVDVLPRSLDLIFPEDVHKRVSGRLFVCMTRLKDMKCVIVNEFETRQDLIDALNCSCFIPVWSGNHVSTYKGVKHIDGGLSNNMPVFDEHTIRISCFSGASDIAPYDRAKYEFLRASLTGMPFYLNWNNIRRFGRALWPPPPSYIIGLMERGYQDTKDFLLSNDMIQCDACFKSAELVFSKLAPTISPALSRNGSRAGSLRRANPTNVATIKQLEAMQLDTCDDAPPALDPAQRAKSGRQITLGALKRARRTGSKGSGKSLGRKLREKLTRAAPAKKAPADARAGRARAMSMPLVAPTIVVDSAAHEGEEGEELEDAAVGLEEACGFERPTQTIGEIMRRQAAELEARADIGLARTSSVSSSTNSTPASDESGDSAVGGLYSRAAAIAASRPATQSPSDKFLASRKMSLAAPAEATAAEQQPPGLPSGAAAGGNGSGSGSGNALLPDRFAFAPSQLPSCPPSPNLNRHCSECIRLRQQARMDEIDESILQEAERYRNLESRDPAKEFNTFRFKLAGWLRDQLGAQKKYSYELFDAHEADEPARTGVSAPPSSTRQRQRRPSEIPTN